MIRLPEDGILYHGSYTTVQSVNFSMYRSGLDFGKGFYVTSSLNRLFRMYLLPSEKQSEEA